MFPKAEGNCYEQIHTNAYAKSNTLRIKKEQEAWKGGQAGNLNDRCGQNQREWNLAPQRLLAVEKGPVQQP